MVERALERHSTKLSKNNVTFDAEHMLRIREKEIQNSKKQIEVNKNVIAKLKEKLKTLGPTGASDADGKPIPKPDATPPWMKAEITKERN